MSRWARFVVGLFAFVVIPTGAGCAASFDAAGFKHPSYPLTVSYGDRATCSFIADAWRLDNYFLDERGCPTDRKQGPGYERSLRRDFVGSGGQQLYEGPRYEILLHHRRNEGRIWLSLVPITAGDAELALRAFVDRYAIGLSEQGHVHVDVAGQVRVSTAEYAARVLERRGRTIGGVKAMEGTLELANLNQLKLDPESRHSRVRIVFARPGFYARVTAYGGGAPTPLLVVIGYSNTPDDFERGLPNFEAFLKAISM
jgi:hypothetical protein